MDWELEKRQDLEDGDEAGDIGVDFTGHDPRANRVGLLTWYFTVGSTNLGELVLGRIERERTASARAAFMAAASCGFTIVRQQNSTGSSPLS